ncbi:uncharacterized protein LOC134241651 [Saccostrea cucullata]|uniref:uncharacterized protein LOC134241651 n=1 Tax=Saccostrea cuccullata TaxID=36930 RepID=UPI002ED02428
MQHIYREGRRNTVVFLVYLTFLASISEASITLTVHPSSSVEVNQTVTIQCTFSQAPGAAYFLSSVNPTAEFCSLESAGGVCRQTECARQYTTLCPNSTTFLVTSVTLTPNQVTVDAGKQITLTCQTDYCNPAANITWYKESTDVTSQAASSTVTDSNDLVRTTSVLQYTGVAGDNGQQMYCRAMNRPGKNVGSNKYILDVRCK